MMATQPKTCDCGRFISPRNQAGKCQPCVNRARNDPREWCPPHLIETYNIIRSKAVPPDDAKAMVLEHYEVEKRRSGGRPPVSISAVKPPQPKVRPCPHREVVKRSSAQPSIQPGPIADGIISAVADAFKIAKRELTSGDRNQYINRARVVAIRLLRDVPGIDAKHRFSMTQIGAMLGGRDHSTITHALYSFEDMVKRDADVAKVYERLSAGHD